MVLDDKAYYIYGACMIATYCNIVHIVHIDHHNIFYYIYAYHMT